jgi:hypothetical protein
MVSPKPPKSTAKPERRPRPERTKPDREEIEMNREERMEDLAETDDMDDDLTDEVSVEEDDENESDFLDKPDDVSGDDEYSRS